MKTYLALTALLYSLASAVDLYDDDDQLDIDDQLDGLPDDDDQLDNYDFSFDKEMTYGGFRYLYSNEQVSWYAAKSICEEEGGSLLTIRDNDELTAVQSILPPKRKPTNKKSPPVHFGLYNTRKETGEDIWRWEGSGEPLTAGEQATSNLEFARFDFAGGECVHLWVGVNNNPRVGPKNCNAKRRFICKVPDGEHPDKDDDIVCVRRSEL